MKAILTTSLWLAATAAFCQPLTLTDALATARKHRGDVAAAELAFQSARLEARALGAYPAVTLAAGQSSRADLGATDQDLAVSLPLDAFGRTAAARRVGQAVVLGAEAARARALLEVQTQVMTAYFEAVASARLAAVSHELLALAESLLGATVRRFEEGKVPETQVKRAQIERDRANQTAEFRAFESAAARKRLAGAIGRESLDAELDLAATLVEPAGKLGRRPDVLALRAAAAQAKAEAGRASRERLPDLELIGLRSPWRDDPVRTGARLQLTWRLLDFGAAAHEAKGASARSKAAEAAVADALLRAQAELGAVEDELAAGRARVGSYLVIRTAAMDLLQKSQTGFEQGYGTLLEVLEAGRALREIEQELAEARLALDLATVAKYEATGTLVEVAA